MVCQTPRTTRPDSVVPQIERLAPNLHRVPTLFSGARPFSIISDGYFISVIYRVGTGSLKVTDPPNQQ